MTNERWHGWRLLLAWAAVAWLAVAVWVGSWVMVERIVGWL